MPSRRRTIITGLSGAIFLAGCTREKQNNGERLNMEPAGPEQGNAESISRTKSDVEIDRDEHTRQCGQIAGKVVFDHLENNLEIRLENVEPRFNPREEHVLISMLSSYTRDGNLLGEPNVTYQEVLDNSPKTISLTISNSEIIECEWPVMVRHVVEQLE